MTTFRRRATHGARGLPAVALAVAIGCGSSPTREPSAPSAPGAAGPTGTSAGTDNVAADDAATGSDDDEGTADPAEACSEVIAVINRGVDALQTSENSAGNPTDELRAMAAIMERVARETNEVEIDDDKLAGLATEYRTMAERVAQAALDLASAADASDAAKLGDAERELKSAVEAEDSLVNRINDRCQGR